MGYFKRKVDRARIRHAKRQWASRWSMRQDSWMHATPGALSAESRRFVRLAVSERDRASNQSQGIFHAASPLCDDPELSADARAALQRAFRWFALNLVAPRDMDTAAVFWFKRRSVVAWNHLRNMVAALRK